LSKIYRYAIGFAFIGGKGYKHRGLPSCFGGGLLWCTYLFGPEIRKFPEAIDLVKSGACSLIQNSSDFVNQIHNWIENIEEKERNVSERPAKFIKDNGRCY
jgi:3-deoxy-D-manno-octulosonic-acid transferase